MKLKKVVIIIPIAFILIIGSFMYYEKIQAKNLYDKFNIAMQQRKYQEARDIYNKSNSNRVINKLFSFNDNAERIVEDNFKLIKNEYISEKISFEQYNKELNLISAFNFIPKESIENSLAEVKKIENVRQAYIVAEKLYNDKKYSEALQSINNIQNIDKKTTDKSNSLREVIIKDYLNEINTQVDALIKSENYDGALKLLDEKKSIYTENDINSKVKYINDLIIQKNEKERKMQEEKKRQEEQKKREEELKAQKESSSKAAVSQNNSANATKENIIRNQASSTQFLIWVSLSEQTVSIFTGQKDDWKLIKSFSASTGKAGYETPKGTFTITGRGEWFYNSTYTVGALYWTQFYGNYLFHSILVDKNRNIVDPNLGTPLSHGCIRLDIDNAKWIYDNIPNKTKVIIN